jgi:class 3 adenylate cyclase
MSYTILIVDDSEDWRATLRAIFRKTDIVHTAASVEQAEDLLAQHAFDVMLLDMVLDTATGSHISVSVQLFLESLRHTHPRLPIVAVTGQPLGHEDVFSMPHLGIRHFIGKGDLVVHKVRDDVQQIIERARSERGPDDGPAGEDTGDPELEAFLGVLDIRDSTRRIVGNPALSQDRVMRYIELVLADVRDQIRDFATFTQFLGDGLQFTMPAAPNPSGRNVCHTLAGLSSQLATLDARNKEVRRLAREAQLPPPQVRVAVAYGRIVVGEVVGRDVMGVAAVHATRICAADEIYTREKTSLLITRTAYNEGARFGLWQAADFGSVGETELKDLAAPLWLYKPTFEV